jgi:hypothetical protein
MRSALFQRFASCAAIAAGGGGVAYGIAFLLFLHNGSRSSKIAISLLLLLGGLATSAVLVGLYEWLRDVDGVFALWALILGQVGAVASALHGGFDLARAIRHLSFPDVDAVDPRGLATFGFTGVAIGILAWLMTRDRRFPRGLGRLGLGAAAGLVLLYLGRISLFNPHRPLLLVLLVIMGFVANPAWYLWVGIHLMRRLSPSAAPVVGGA